MSRRTRGRVAGRGRSRHGHKFTQLSSLNFNGCQFFPTVHFKFHGNPGYTKPHPLNTLHRGVSRVVQRRSLSGSGRPDRPVSSLEKIRDFGDFVFTSLKKKSQLGDCLCCVGGCLPADRPAELWAKMGCLGRLDRMERCKNTKHFFLLVLSPARYGSRGIHHRIFAHRKFFRRQMPIKECSSWIYTHHEGLPIVFYPSGKIPTWIYTHHHFAH